MISDIGRISEAASERVARTSRRSLSSLVAALFLTKIIPVGMSSAIAIKFLVQNAIAVSIAVATIAISTRWILMGKLDEVISQSRLHNGQGGCIISQQTLLQLDIHVPPGRPTNGLSKELKRN